MSRRKPPPKDACAFCLGAKGGAPGNETAFAGHLACDFCATLILDVRREAAAAVQSAMPKRVRTKPAPTVPPPTPTLVPPEPDAA
jgi:hypothetical protein